MPNSSTEVPKIIYAIGDKLYTRDTNGDYKRLRIHSARWRALSVWVAVFTLVTFFVLGLGRHEDKAIQRSRVTSCVRTYGSFNEVFTPFFPPTGKRTAKQDHDLAKLQRIIVRLQHGCSHQIKTHP